MDRILKFNLNIATNGLRVLKFSGIFFDSQEIKSVLFSFENICAMLLQLCLIFCRLLC